MNANPEYEPEAYDVTCRVCEWQAENLSPTRAAMRMLQHSDHHENVGEPYFAMRVRSGFLGRDAENAVQTPEDGWNRPPEVTDE